MENSFVIELDLDELELAERHAALYVDEDIKVLARENRVILHVKTLTSTYNADSKRFEKQVQLHCVAHPHPDCNFISVRLAVSFSEETAVCVENMIPGEVLGKEPVKFTSTSKGGLSPEYQDLKLGDIASVEQSKEYQAHVPEIIGTGVGTQRAVWTFQKPLEAVPLHVNQHLVMLISLPEDRPALTATFSLRAQAAIKGVMRHLPLLGRKAEEFTFEASVN